MRWRAICALCDITKGSVTELYRTHFLIIFSTVWIAKTNYPQNHMAHQKTVFFNHMFTASLKKNALFKHTLKSGLAVFVRGQKQGSRGHKRRPKPGVGALCDII